MVALCSAFSTLRHRACLLPLSLPFLWTSSIPLRASCLSAPSVWTSGGFAGSLRLSTTSTTMCPCITRRRTSVQQRWWARRQERHHSSCAHILHASALSAPRWAHLYTTGGDMIQDTSVCPRSGHGMQQRLRTCRPHISSALLAASRGLSRAPSPPVMQARRCTATTRVFLTTGATPTPTLLSLSSHIPSGRQRRWRSVGGLSAQHWTLRLLRRRRTRTSHALMVGLAASGVTQLACPSFLCPPSPRSLWPRMLPRLVHLHPHPPARVDLRPSLLQTSHRLCSRPGSRTLSTHASCAQLQAAAAGSVVCAEYAPTGIGVETISGLALWRAR